MRSYSLEVRPIEEYTSAVIAGILRIISAGALLLLVLGCGPSFNYEGVWRGNRDLKINSGENPGVVRTLGQVTLEIKGNTFKLTEAGMPVAGSVTFRDGKARLKIETRAGTPIEREPKEIQGQIKEIELTPRSDGNMDFYDPGGFFPDPLTLKREPPKN